MTRQTRKLTQIRRTRRLNFKRANRERRFSEYAMELKNRLPSPLEIQPFFYEDLNRRITASITPQTAEIIQKTASAIGELAFKLSDAVIAHFRSVTKD